MPDITTASSPMGTAGAADGLKAAFDAAAEKLDFGDASFATDAMEAPATVEQPVDQEPSESVTEASEPGVESAEEKARRQRDEKGRFAKEAADKAAAKPAPTPEALTAPQNWDDTRKATFGKLPADAQKLVLDISKGLEAAHTRRSTELAEDKRFADGIRGLISDGAREQLRRQNMSEADGVSYLLQLNDAATKNPAGYVRWFAQQANIDARSIFPELSGGQAATDQPQGDQPAIDPRFHQLLQEHTRPLQQELDAIKRDREAQAQQQLRAKVSDAGEAIAKFRSAVDESGNLKHPHLERVQGAVQELISSHPSIRIIPDMSERLARAYKLAVLADPELEAQVVDSEVQRKEAERRRQEDVTKARRASPVLRSSNPTVSTAKPKSLDDALRGAMSKMGVS